MSDEIIQVNPLVFGGEGESVHANVLTKLWENPNPAAAFVAQNIDLSSDDYDLLLIEWAYGADGTPKYVPAVIVPKGQTIQLNAATATGSGVGAIYRNIAYVNDTRLQASDCYLKDMTNTAVAYNTLAIPVFVYGLKKSLDITAIVSNVSTDASKCMLSDGVTSVETALDGGTYSTLSLSPVSSRVSITTQRGIKKGGLVSLYIDFTFSADVASGDISLMNTLPENLRPSADTKFVLVAHSGNSVKATDVVITTAGNIYSKDGMSNGYKAVLNVSYYK